MKYQNLEKLIETIRILRSPEGCQWDREQTHKSLRPNMLEEAYEAVDAIDSGDMSNLKEELGDVLLQVLLHSQIADDEGEFNIDDVSKELNEKLIHRHPHVFGNQKVNSTAEILDNWDLLKKEEKKDRKSAMDGISKSQSALMSAQKISKRAVKTGFEWPNEKSLYECVFCELHTVQILLSIIFSVYNPMSSNNFLFIKFVSMKYFCFQSLVSPFSIMLLYEKVDIKRVFTSSSTSKWHFPMAGPMHAIMSFGSLL